MYCELIIEMLLNLAGQAVQVQIAYNGIYYNYIIKILWVSELKQVVTH